MPKPLHTARCLSCGREVSLSDLATDTSGRPVLAWHYTKKPAKDGRPGLKPRECPGSGKANYRPGEFK